MITQTEMERLKNIGLIRHFEDNENTYLDRISIHINTAKYATNGIITNTTLEIAENGFRDELEKWPKWQKFMKKALHWHLNPDPSSEARLFCRYIFNNREVLKKIIP